jgi:hypothetical protein
MLTTLWAINTDARRFEYWVVPLAGCRAGAGNGSVEQVRSPRHLYHENMPAGSCSRARSGTAWGGWLGLLLPRPPFQTAPVRKCRADRNGGRGGRA